MLLNEMVRILSHLTYHKVTIYDLINQLAPVDLL